MFFHVSRVFPFFFNFHLLPATPSNTTLFFRTTPNKNIQPVLTRVITSLPIDIATLAIQNNVWMIVNTQPRLLASHSVVEPHCAIRSGTHGTFRNSTILPTVLIPCHPIPSDTLFRSDQPMLHARCWEKMARWFLIVGDNFWKWRKWLKLCKIDWKVRKMAWEWVTWRSQGSRFDSRLARKSKNHKMFEITSHFFLDIQFKKHLGTRQSLPHRISSKNCSAIVHRWQNHRKPSSHAGHRWLRAVCTRQALFDVLNANRSPPHQDQGSLRLLVAERIEVVKGVANFIMAVEILNFWMEFFVPSLVWEWEPWKWPLTSIKVNKNHVFTFFHVFAFFSHFFTHFTMFLFIFHLFLYIFSFLKISNTLRKFSSIEHKWSASHKPSHKYLSTANGPKFLFISGSCLSKQAFAIVLQLLVALLFLQTSMSHFKA